MDDCAKRLSEETSGLVDLDISSLNIKTDYFCVDKMCKMEKGFRGILDFFFVLNHVKKILAKNIFNFIKILIKLFLYFRQHNILRCRRANKLYFLVGLIYDESDLKRVGDVKLSLMELYFLLHPCCTFRTNILRILNSYLAEDKKLTQLTYKDAISIFYFICQFDESDSSLLKFSKFDKLYLISKRLLKAKSSGDIVAESLSVNACQQFRQQMCLDNVSEFCAIVVILNANKIEKLR